jgi:vancomycin resistance protein YoaR
MSLVVLLSAATAVDAAAHRGRTLRNVAVGRVEVGGETRDELRTHLASLTPNLTATPVELVVGSTSARTSLGALGVEVDIEATIEQAMQRGREGSLWLRPLRWLAGLVRTRDTAPVLRLDRERLTTAIAPYEQAEDTEVRFTIVRGSIDAEAGQQGRRVDIGRAGDALLAAARRGDDPLRLELALESVPRRITDEALTRLETEANTLASRGITLTIPRPAEPVTPVTIDRATLLGWLRPERTGDSWKVGIDRDTPGVVAAARFAGAARPGNDATIVAPFGIPVIVGGDPATRCCTDDTATRIITALRAGRTDAELAMVETPRPRGREWAATLGIVEVVGEFTTNYVPGESRNVNIARISELTRGALIEPGKTFSVNQHVGQRTAEKGFVAGGAIYDGVFTQDIGGGVSQYATTLFNAAFFAGLDFPEYQSHSIYISRYPYGREATISWPKPDLRITNNAPTGILVWPTTTDRSITVRLFGTKHAPGTQTGQRESRQGAACTRVTTERTRTFPDGSTKKDNVVAVYQPAEGIGCDGNPTVSTTTLPPPPTTEAPPPPPPPPPTTTPVPTTPTPTTPAPTTAPVPTTAAPAPPSASPGASGPPSSVTTRAAAVGSLDA